MALASYFFHDTTRRYIALFGSIFNEISLRRDDAEGNKVQQIIVPLNYGPYQKWLIKATQDGDLNYKPATIMPRMSFEITSITYDGPRKINSLKKIKLPDNDTVYAPAPYNIDFTLTIMTKYAKDGTQIVEQILPFFKPEKTFSVELIKGMEYLDIPIVLTSVSCDDGYEADFETRRTILWTLTFTMKGYYFGPVSTPKRIKFIDVRMNTTENPGAATLARITAQPGLTEDGYPTTDIDETISYQDIDMDDDWATITIVEENIEEINE